MMTSENVQNPPPVFFRHVPKTAGTSITTTMANLFSEERSRRFRQITLDTPRSFAHAVSRRGAALDFVSGHIPIALIPDTHRAVEFTFLREPVARVLSFQRFMRIQPAAERARLGLSADVTVPELLSSSNPEVFGQVRNGMTRFFTRYKAFADGESPEFWNGMPEVLLLDDVLSVLSRMTVGMSEDMLGALRLLQRRLGIPFELEVGVENATADDALKVAPAEIAALTEANILDLTIYREVAARARQAALNHRRWLDTPADLRLAFRPEPGHVYRISEIPGRQGFELYEPDSAVSWIGNTGRARIHLGASLLALTLSFRLYFVVPNYPFDEVRFLLNGERWPASAQPPGLPNKQRWTFTLDPIPPHTELAELTLVQPLGVPVRAVTPDSPDKRILGVAVTEIGSTH